MRPEKNLAEGRAGTQRKKVSHEAFSSLYAHHESASNSPVMKKFYFPAMKKVK
jgi:hypothetical protein